MPVLVAAPHEQLSNEVQERVGADYVLHEGELRPVLVDVLHAANQSWQCRSFVCWRIIVHVLDLRCDRVTDVVRHLLATVTAHQAEVLTRQTAEGYIARRNARQYSVIRPELVLQRLRPPDPMSPTSLNMGTLLWSDLKCAAFLSSDSHLKTTSINLSCASSVGAPESMARRATRCAATVSPHPDPDQTEPTRMRPQSWHARTHQPSSSAVMFTKMRFAKAAIQSVLSAKAQGHSTAARLRTSWRDGVLLALRFKARSVRPFDGDTGGLETDACFGDMIPIPSGTHRGPGLCTC